MSNEAQPLLTADGLGVRFGGVAAVDNVSFQVRAGQIVSLIGPNGAGKTTTANAITGFVAASSGTVQFAGENIAGWRPERIAKAGMVRTFQNAAMFASMSVADNLATGQFLTSKTGIWQTLLRTPGFRLERNETRDQVDRVLDLLRLRHRRDVIAGALPYGEQRVLGLGIALMTQPKLLLLDEPAAGLSPDETKLMGRLIRIINGQGITVLLIEHNMSLVMSISAHIIVLKQGKKLAEGTPRFIREHPDVVEAYLGVEA
ncbi:ABC transporter ATP-binding protein [Bradyrhizobium sp. dw_411]|uniref:ABC transporter ATP-binding protein n=1 Tax=Bradyrhizobium sp. dw_411 TaxID=2720082 RepID=UPI001BD0D6FF|nr:ABC transporter ATP-binding protein [Bradyrhizobium sp. dw_411]